MSVNIFRKRDDVIGKIMHGKALRPIVKDGVIILWDEIPEYSPSAMGIIMPRKAIDDVNYRVATVLFVADDVVAVKPMDRIVISKFIGTTINHDDSSSCVMKLISCDQIDAMLTGDDSFSVGDNGPLIIV